MKKNERRITNFEERRESKMFFNIDDVEDLIVDFEKIGLKDTMSKDEQIEFLKHYIQNLNVECEILTGHVYTLQFYVSDLKKYVDEDVLKEISRRKREITRQNREKRKGK
ncbi:MAG: hypothetical protein K5659_04730 [Lachnospiraceae bacterium]|nr:hypothetical protein [Lachnospiraceae bacterium]